MMNEEFRYRTEQVPLTLRQRADIWWKGVVDAIRAKPETHWTRWIQVKEGEAGYDIAGFTWRTESNPMRFRYEKENGTWVRVDTIDDSEVVNPSWHNP